MYVCKYFLNLFLFVLKYETINEYYSFLDKTMVIADELNFIDR